MGYNTSEGRLGLVSQGVVRSIIAVSDELERVYELPLQVDRQSDRYLVAGVEIIG